MTFANGKKYMGGFDRAKKHGKGIFWNTEGEMYEGTWNHDKKVGHFKITHRDTGLIYDGDIGAFRGE